MEGRGLIPPFAVLAAESWRLPASARIGLRGPFIGRVPPTGAALWIAPAGSDPQRATPARFVGVGRRRGVAFAVLDGELPADGAPFVAWREAVPLGWGSVCFDAASAPKGPCAARLQGAGVVLGGLLVPQEGDRWAVVVPGCSAWALGAFLRRLDRVTLPGGVVVPGRAVVAA